MDEGEDSSRSVAAHIRRSLGRLTPTERRPALTLLANYPVAGLETVAQFAERANVSGPTILRLVAKLGFASYLDFQKRLRQELEARLQSPLGKPAEANPAARPAAHFAQQAAANVTATMEALAEADFEGIVTLLADPRRRIHLVGGRFGDALARYFASHLRIVRADVAHVQAQPGAWADLVVDMDKRDVLVCFDIRRYQDSLVRFAEKAHQRGVQIVLFTDQWLSPIARFARHVIAGRTAVPSPWDSSAALFVVTEMVIEAVTRQLEQDGSRRLREIESLR